MNKQILVILSIVIISLINLISLTTALYSGECMEVPLGNLSMSQDIIYLVVGNSTNTIGMNIKLNETTESAKVCFEVNYQSDNFTLVFLNKVTQEVIVEVPVSGGGRSIRYIENQTIIEVPTYIDREIYVDKEIYVEKDVEMIDIDNDIEPTFEWYYLYGSILIILVIIVYYWARSVKEVEDEDK